MAATEPTKRLLVEPQKCVGCRVCELVCSGRHFGEFASNLSAITVVKYDEVSRDVPLVCRQCEEPACATVCAVGAIARSGLTGALVVDHAKCIGCRLCVDACPYGSMGFDVRTQRVVKCDLCGGEPECVRICPSDCLKYSGNRGPGNGAGV